MKSLAQTIKHAIKRAYDKTHLFTDQEAWGVYRFGAFVHAGIWAFFIATIVYLLMGLPLGVEVMKFGRSIMGVSFTVYLLLTLLVVRSMEWKASRIIVAVIAGVVPLASLVFEHSIGKYRKAHPAYIEPPKNYDPNY